VRDEGDRREILQRVVWQVFAQRGIDRVRGTREEQRVTVGRRIRRELRRDHLPAAAAVVDHHLLAERFGELRREEPSDDVACAAGRIGNDHAHGALRVGLRGTACGVG
jgi:hypothetical protein